MPFRLRSLPSVVRLLLVVAGALVCAGRSALAQSFGTSELDLAGLASVSSGTSLEFGPDGRLYVLSLDGTVDVLTIQRNGVDDYVVVAAEELDHVRLHPNRDDDGQPDATSGREATGLTVRGTATNPVIYVASSDPRVGGPSGDKDLDTNSGVITRIRWSGTAWESVDLVRGLPRSEENHATNGMEEVTLGGTRWLLVCQGGHANAGGPSTNFAWSTEYALSAAVLAIDLTTLESLPVLNDGTRDYVYDLPTVDDPTRANVNGIVDPADPGYDGVDLDDPWGGNDGLNQAKVVDGGPVRIFSPGYRNAYDLVVTESGGVYVTDNGANGGWGGYPDQEGTSGAVTNDYRPGEPGSNDDDPEFGDDKVNNKDHLTWVTDDVSAYTFGSFYAGHPTPVRANPAGAGLFARGAHSSDPLDENGNGYTDDWFRTLPFDPQATGDAADPQRALPADWPPVPLALANPVEGDYRNPGGSNPDGVDDLLMTTWGNNSNGIDEYTASNFGGAMQGDLIAGRSGGRLHRVQLNPDGSLATLTQNWVTGLDGNPLGVTCNGDDDPFPGTIWLATFNDKVAVLEPQDFVLCILPGEPDYDPLADNDSDGYANDDEESNGTDACNGGSRPADFDASAGAPFLSDLLDADDDADGIDDALDVLQLGDPTDAGSDAFVLPVVNELFSGNPLLGGYLGLGFTGLMNNGDPNPNWLAWLDVPDAGPNPNDILGGAVGAVTMQMTAGTAVGPVNSQEKAFQYGIQVDAGTGGFRVESRLLGLGAGLQLYPFAASDGPDAELGIFLGDGTQSEFVQIVVDANGVELVAETGDVPQTLLWAPLAVADRPTTSLTLRLDVDSVTGSIEALYAVDDGAFVSMGSVPAGGEVLNGIQNAESSLVVGLIGSSHAPGFEVEGTWDNLLVLPRTPGIQEPLPDVEEPLGGALQRTLDLDDFFADDDGDENLTYTIVFQSDPSIVVTIQGNLLVLDLPAFAASSTITIRATDADGNFVEQTFTVSVSAPTVLYRVNAGGDAELAIDGGPDWEEDTTASGSVHLLDAGSNNASGFAMTGFAPAVDLSTTPTEIFDTERWDKSGGGAMHYSFAVSGDRLVELRLYMGNGWSGTSEPGERVFSVELEGAALPGLTNIALSDLFGHTVGGVLTETVEVTDGALDVVFLHGGGNNPLVNGLEVIDVGPLQGVSIVLTPVPDQASVEGDTVALPVLASGGDTGTFAFSAGNLPAGLQIEPTTGLIFGTLLPGSSVGSPHPVHVTVDDGDADPGDAKTTFFSWEVRDPAVPIWIDLDEDESYTGRHECSFVQAGDRFFLFGGRENAQTLDTYDYAGNSWSTSAPAPLPFNHFQALEHEGLVWVAGAFETNSFPNEDPADHVWIFDPANDVWVQGPEIPVARRRGGAGLVEYGGVLYLVGGNTIGHNGGYVPWFDAYDPVNGTWTVLSDAPHARDHFHAAVVGDELIVAGGRLSGGPGGTFAPLVPEVDVYDLLGSTWSTLPASSDLPTPRAGTATAVFGGKVLVIGGEGGGQAYDTVEALDPSSWLWETVDSLNHKRHGTQAIVSGGGVYVIAGSPNQGGGNQKKLEVYGADAPSGAPSSAGVLALAPGGPLFGGSPSTVLLGHVGGSQGLLVTDLAFSGASAADFALVDAPPLPFLVPVGGVRELGVAYSGTAAWDTAVLQVTLSGGTTESVRLRVAPPLPLRGSTGGRQPKEVSTQAR